MNELRVDSVSSGGFGEFGWIQLVRVDSVSSGGLNSGREINTESHSNHVDSTLRVCVISAPCAGRPKTMASDSGRFNCKKSADIHCLM